MDTAELGIYKHALVAASHTQQTRHSQLSEKIMSGVGNVFLPSLPHPKSTSRIPHSELSMKHLEVIEQCIIAENRREEQLAKCSTAKERRYWTKRFQVQRKHERELIDALMLDQASISEVEIVEVETSRTAYVSPLLGRALPASSHHRTNDDCNGAALSHKNPDKVFRMDATRASKSPTHRSSRSTVHLPNFGSEGKRSRLKETHHKPTHERRRSRSRSRSRSPVKCSPTKRTIEPLDTTKASDQPSASLTNSPAHSSTSPTKRSKNPESIANRTDHTIPMSTDDVISFGGATSYLEAKYQAEGALQKQRGLVEGGTQMTERPGSPVEDIPLPKQEMVLMLTQTHHISPTSPAKTKSCSMEIMRDSLTTHCSNTVESIEKLSPVRLTGRHLLPARARSSPQLRGRPAFALDDLEVGPVTTVHYFQLNGTSLMDGVTTYVSEDQTKKIHFLPKSRLPQVLVNELALSVPSSVEAQCKRERDVLETFESQIEQGQKTSTLESEKNEAVELKDQEVIDILEDLIVMIEVKCAAEAEEEARALHCNISPYSRGHRHESATLQVLYSVIRIQSAFRGHHTRRNFRRALYEEGLNCGVLGAMPGTLQGKSGWYQDPKTFMAHYFVVRDDGNDWKQKMVVRCNSLILTPYQMHKEITSKVELFDED